MLDLDYIKANTLWVIKYSSHRTTVKGSEISKYQNDEDVRDMDTVHWKHQPAELQEFWRAYEYAYYTLDRKDLFLVDDFYAEWIKNPSQFKAGHRNVISTLRKELDFRYIASNEKINVLIVNYDKQTIGNHYLENWLDALKLIEDDFDIVESNVDGNNISIVIQCDDLELIDQLSYLGNKCAASNAF